jgi:hypothetical protein
MALWLAVVWLPVFDVASAAQAAPPPDVRKDAKMRLGPFYITPTFLVKDVGLDTNVFDTPIAPKSDFTATFVPRADVWVPFAHRALITTSTAAAFVYYLDSPEARSIDPDFLIRGDVFARNTTFYGSYRYLQTRERSVEVDAALARRTLNSASGGAMVKLGNRLLLDAAGYHDQLEYEEDVFFGTNLRESLNRTEQGVRVTVRHKTTPLTTILVRAETQQARFVYSPVRDADGFRLAPGVEFSPKALIAGSAEVGLRQFAGKSPELPDFRGLVAKTSLTYTLLETTRFGFVWNRDAIYSFELAWPYAVVNTLSGSVRRQIRGQVDGIFSALRATYDYQNFETNLDQRARRDVVISYSVDVGYRLSRDARVGVVVTSWNRESNEFVRGYQDLRVGMSLMYTLPG